MKLAPQSLRQRLLWAIMTPLCLVFAVGAVLDYHLAQATANTVFDRALADIALDLALHIGGRAQAFGVVTPSKEVEAIVRRDATDTIYFAIHDQTGVRVAGDAGLELPLPELSALGQRYCVDSTLQQQVIRACIHRVHTAHGALTITAAETVNKRDHVRQRIMTAMVLPSLVIILMTLLIIYFGVRKGLLPLQQVEAEIASRSPKDLRPIEMADPPKEMRPMLGRLNDLFDLLRDAAAAQQRFLADAAHQLRTPLTGLQTQIELVSSEGLLDADSERMLRMTEAADRIGHLVNQLLIYARTDAGVQPSLVFEPVALNELVEHSASLFLDQALHKGIDLGFDAQAAAVSGVAWMLGEALANLIDNALRYSAPGGIVTVASHSDQNTAVLSVEDNGPGIPASERQRVFDRFYRMRASSGDGCGLGLAIVQEIVVLHRGDIVLQTPDGGGLRISLVFPALAA